MKIVFMRHKRLLLLLIAVLFGLILLPAVSYFHIPFERPTSFEAAVVGALFSIFLVFFILLQLTYSVHEVPRRIVQQYSLYVWQTAVFMMWCGASITGCVYVAILPQGRASYPVLTAILALSILGVVVFFSWFVKSTSVQGILKAITNESKMRYEHINREESRLKPAYDCFSDGLKELRKRHQNIDCDIYRAVWGFPSPHYTLSTNVLGYVEEINLEHIEERLQPVLQCKELEVVIEVYPGCVIPEKDAKFQPAVRNHHLLTVAASSWLLDEKKKRLLLKRLAPGAEVCQTDSERKLDDYLKEAFQGHAQQVSDSFMISHRLGESETDTTPLEDFRQAAVHALTEEKEVKQFLASLKEIMVDQLYGVNQEVFLGLKRAESWRISQCVMDIISASLATGNTGALRKIISQFYTLVYERFAEVKNPEILQDLFDVLTSTNRLYMRNARSYFCDSIALLPLNIHEFIGYNFLRQFKSEKGEKELARYFEPVITAAINSSYAINLQNLRSFSYGDHIYGESYLQHQLQSFLNLLEFYPEHEVECFPTHEEYWEMTRESGYSQSADFKVMTSKLVITKRLRRHLASKALELVIFAFYWFQRESLSSRIVSQYMLPVGEVLRDAFGSFLLEFIHDQEWANDVKLRLHTQDISPPGTYTPRLHNLKTFWIIFCIHSVITAEQLLAPKAPLWQTEIDELKAAVNQLALAPSLWAPALKISEQEFSERLRRLNTEIQDIKPVG